MRRTSMRAILVLSCVFALVPTGARAQCGAGVATTIDPSARALGMGGASSAVFWGGDPDDWANPALLGYHHGIRYGASKYRLVPDLATDVFFTSTRITLGGWGVGLSFAGQPDHLGGSRLDYGLSEEVGLGGELIGVFNSYETVESFGLGVNVLELVESVLGLGGVRSNWGQWGDVSFGWARKEVVVDLFAGGGFPVGIERARAETNDLGFLVRLRPIDTLTRAGWGPKAESLGGLCVDAVFAMSSRNHDDELLDFGVGNTDPLGRDDRLGFSVHAATGLPPTWRGRFETRNLGWLAESLAPFLAGGVTWERTEGSVPGSGDDRTECSTADLWGAELIVANMLSMRWGYVKSEDRAIDEATWGVGLGFALGGFLGVRYDHASTPQAAGLADRGDQGVTAWVDGVALARLVRGE